jgi:hypothetical protein
LQTLRYDTNPQQPGVAHENGSIEFAHGHLKRAIDDAFALRDSKGFADLESYRAFIDQIIERHNTRHDKSIHSERTALQRLPVNRTDDFKRHLERLNLMLGQL